MKITTKEQAVEHFRDVWPKVQIQDNASYGTRVVKGVELKGFIIKRVIGAEEWMVLTNGIIQNL